MQSSRTITSLALVKVIWDHLRQSFLDAFIPLVATILATRNYTSLYDEDIHKLCKDFEDHFGFRVPYHPMISILHRSKKVGLLTRHQGRFIVVKDKLADYDSSKRAVAQETALAGLVDRFVAFVKEHFSIDLARQDAEEAFINFLRVHDLDILFAASDGSVLPEIKPSKRLRYLFARFLQHIQQHELGLFQFVVNVAVGHTLANALLYREFDRFSARLRNVHIYCDTRFLLRLLGAEGEEREQSYYALVKVLRASQGKLHVFSHTHDEMMGILQTCQRWVGRSTRFDPAKGSLALTYFIQHGFTQTDVDDFIVQAERTLRDLEIDLVQPPLPSELVEFQLDEMKLKETIVQIYETRGPFDDVVKGYTLDRDIKSIAAVHKLRRGRMPISVAQAGHIFITTNSSLAYASHCFESAKNPDTDPIPMCLTDVFVGTILWVQSPAIVSTLNETRLVAQCSAALQLDQSMIKKLVKVATRLKEQGKVSEEQFYLLRASPVVHQLLAEKTLGDPEAFSAKTVEEVLVELQEKAKSQEVVRYEREAEDHRQTRLRLASEQFERAWFSDRLEHLSTRAGGVGANAVLGSLVILAGLGFVLPFFKVIEHPAAKVFGIAAALVFGLGSVLYGFNLLSIRDWVAARIKALTYRALAGSRGP